MSTQILVVDDEPRFIRLVEANLVTEGFEVIKATDGQQAVDAVAKDRPDLVLLDAVTMGIDRKFDAVYSNKVLHHLTREDLAASLHRQAIALKDKGILLHSLWYGDKEVVLSGLRFVYYTRESFARVVGSEYEIVEAERYTEMEDDDSIYFVLKKRR